MESKMELSDKTKQELQDIASRYPVKGAAIVPSLMLAQEEFGYLSDEVISSIAEELELPAIRLAQVASFYPMLRREPSGKYRIQVCRTLSCSLLGAEHLVEYLKDKLNIDVGETTADGKFTLTEVECLSSCGTAPVMMINDELYEELTETKIEQILE